MHVNTRRGEERRGATGGAAFSLMNRTVGVKTKHHLGSGTCSCTCTLFVGAKYEESRRDCQKAKGIWAEPGKPQDWPQTALF